MCVQIGTAIQLSCLSVQLVMLGPNHLLAQQAQDSLSPDRCNQPAPSYLNNMGNLGHSKLDCEVTPSTNAQQRTAIHT
jgi:hypothetical protein